jgi:hypothetical protein
MGGGGAAQGGDMEQNCRAFAFTQHLGARGQLPGASTLMQVRRPGSVWLLQNIEGDIMTLFHQQLTSMRIWQLSHTARDSRNSGRSARLGWGIQHASRLAIAPQPAHEHPPPPRIQPSCKITHPSDARHMALSGAHHSKIKR